MKNMTEIKCSNCGHMKDENDTICPTCYAVVINLDESIKRLNKMFMNRIYGKFGINNNNFYYTDTDSYITDSCESYWEFNNVKFPCQLKSGHYGMHINNPLKDGHIATILW